MRSDRVVVLSPLLDDNVGLFQAVERSLRSDIRPRSIAIEGLAVAVLPRAARLNVERLCPEPCEPATYELHRHLRTVTRWKAARRSWFGLPCRAA